MSVVSSSLRWGEKAFTVLALLFTLVALWAWLQAVLAWGSPGAFADALLWTLLTLVAWGPSVTIEWVRNRGA